MDNNTGNDQRKRWTKDTMVTEGDYGQRIPWTKETIGKGKCGERSAKQPMRRGDYGQKRQ